MYHHILIPADGSALSTVAVEHSMDFARDADAKVTVLTVVSPFHVFSADAGQLADTRAADPTREPLAVGTSGIVARNKLMKPRSSWKANRSR